MRLRAKKEQNRIVAWVNTDRWELLDDSNLWLYDRTIHGLCTPSQPWVLFDAVFQEFRLYDNRHFSELVFSSDIIFPRQTPPTRFGIQISGGERGQYTPIGLARWLRYDHGLGLLCIEESTPLLKYNTSSQEWMVMDNQHSGPLHYQNILIQAV